MEWAHGTFLYHTGWPDKLQPRIIQAGKWSGPMALSCTVQVGRWREPKSLPCTALVGQIDYNPVSYRLANGVGPWHFPVPYRLADGEGPSHFPILHWLAR